MNQKVTTIHAQRIAVRPKSKESGGMFDNAQDIHFLIMIIKGIDIN